MRPERVDDGRDGAEDKGEAGGKVKDCARGTTLGKAAETKAGLTRSMDTTTFLLFFRIVNVFSERCTTRKGPS